MSEIYREISGNIFWRFSKLHFRLFILLPAIQIMFQIDSYKIRQIDFIWLKWQFSIWFKKTGKAC